MVTLAAGTLLVAVAVSVLACGGGSSVAASGSTGSTRSAGNVHLEHLFGVQPGPRLFDATDGATIANTGIGTVRIGFGWLFAQPRPGPFIWNRLDAEVAALAASGVQVVPQLGGTPSWVASKPTTAPVESSTQRKAWKAFVTAAVERYGPGGDFWRPVAHGPSPFHTRCGCVAPAVPITEWQVWNEPNLTNYYTPEPSPAAYAQLLKITHSAIRKADPNAEVVLGGLSDGGRREHDIGAIGFLKRLYRIHGSKSTFDAAAIHPYARGVSGTRSVIKAIRAVMRHRHDEHTPLWVTEIGWGSAPPNGFGTTKGIRGQRRIVERSMKMFLHERKRWHLQRVYWFFWRDPSKSGAVGQLPCRICYSAGLLHSNREPKPAYRAFKRVASRAP